MLVGETIFPPWLRGYKGILYPEKINGCTEFDCSSSKKNVITTRGPPESWANPEFC